MARTFFRQDTQIRNSDVYDDTVAPALAAFETNPAEIETDLNNIRSMLSHLRDVQVGNWYDALVAPVTFENGTQRGVQDVNQDLHDLERKRVLRVVHNLSDITVPATQNYVILTLGQLPSQTTAAVGTVTTLGTVAAGHTGTFGTHALDEVAGSTPVSPKNLVPIFDGSTRDPILDSSGNRIWALFQTENGADGHTMTGTTPNRAQLSFVVVNGTGDDLIAVAVADIENKVINYCTNERVGLLDLNEADFLGGAITDVPSGSTVTRKVAYDNQGVTPVELTTNATLDLNSAGISWSIRDLLNADLFVITEGSGGGTSTITLGGAVDTFDVDAVVNDFANGLNVATGKTRPIDIGENDGVIETTAGDLEIRGANELFLDDVNQTGSTWAQTQGIKLSETTAEWDAFETEFGEVSLLNAIVQASNVGGITKTCANVTSTTVADTDVGGVAGGANLDAQLHDLSGGDFVGDHDVFLNGALLRGGADATANNDYYPGTSLANGQLKFEFTVKINDVICVISRA